MNLRRWTRAALPHYEQRSQFVRVSLTVALPVFAVLLSEWLNPALDALFEAPFLAAIGAVGWLCGPRHALAATLASALVLDYLFLAPISSLEIHEVGSVVRFVLFLFGSGVIIALIARLNRAASEIESSRQMQRSLSELIPFGSWAADQHGAMQQVSESFAVALGTTSAECQGDGWLQFIDEDQREQVRADWLACMRSGYFWDYEYRTTGRNGMKYTVLSRGVPVRSRSGRIQSWAGIHLDITEMQRSVEEQIRQARDIARFNAELEQFAYISAHDLQEPLRMIGSYLQLLARRYRGKLDDEADTYIGFAVDGANRLRALLQDLLVLQQIGKGQRRRALVSLTAVVNAAVRNLGAAAPARVVCGELPSVFCDEHEFTQLFENLIGNATKYAREGVPAEVHISAEETAGGWVISVTDNGIGIDPEYRERVFEIFQRLHSRAQYPGTGIGLAIAKKIVEVRQGKIWVESTPGAGSTFRFTLSS